MTELATAPKTVVSVTRASGDNSASWDPVVQVSVPSGAVAGTYAGIITHSVS